MWISILLFPDNDTANISVLVARDGTLYVRVTDLIQILFPGRNAWRVCQRFVRRTRRNIGRSAESVLQGVPCRYPKMKIVTFREAIRLVEEFPGGHRFAVYLLDVLTNARVAPVPQKTHFGSFVYCTNPNRASVFRVVQADSVPRDPRLMPRTMPITELMETARTKFLDIYKRFVPEIPSPLNSVQRDETNESQMDDEEENNLVIVTDEEELRRHEQRQQQQQQKQQPTSTQEMEHVFEITFPASKVPREIRWNDGRAIYTFRCVCFQMGTGAESVTLRRGEQGAIEKKGETQEAKEGETQEANV